MSDQASVHVTVDGSPVPGLVLKWDRHRANALVTYEADGRVHTQWVPADQVVPVGS
ncbi:hypothetical protein KVF89_06195 [Nocardioides carbamazepini]|jgi:hypothetical protein|uniref:hypothetical protein n=1 Tax=Nocardioides carbamazepini TaxID=2854259 RepID=UPI00214A36AC|nr:hypothetical protein [Nocardioides carbamazepini]MCR1782117.1 hypothetical protein [Nocardioides carbamazepini]